MRDKMTDEIILHGATYYHRDIHQQALADIKALREALGLVYHGIKRGKMNDTTIIHTKTSEQSVGLIAVSDIIFRTLEQTKGYGDV